MPARRAIGMAAMALLIGGCGGGGPEDNPTGPFRVKAERICSELDRAASPVSASLDRAVQEGRLDDAAGEARRLIDLLGTGIGRLGALEAPAEQAETFAEMVRAFEAGIERGTGLPAALREQNTGWLEAYDRSLAAHREIANRAAAELGLEACIGEG